MRNDTNIHAGIRTTLSGLSDYDNDGYVGFQIVEAREIDTIGTEGIIKKIHDRVGKCTPSHPLKSNFFFADNKTHRPQEPRIPVH